MSKRSALDEFLSDQASSGLYEDEGAFTLAREKAISKLAEFQLPFEGSWSLKLVQSVVAAGQSEAIEIKLQRNKFIMTWDGHGLEIEEVNRHLFEPSLNIETAVGFFVQALWSISFKEGLPFHYQPSGQNKALVWSGIESHIQEQRRTSKVNRLEICTGQPTGSKLAWLANIGNAKNRNAYLTDVLNRYCYPCPIALKIDGRRIDSLLNCRTHGVVRGMSFPLTMGFPKSEDIPSLEISEGTFSGVSDSQDKLRKTISKEPIHHAHGLRMAAGKSMTKLAPVAQSSCPFIFSAHYGIRGRGNQQSVDYDAQASILYWVDHGCVVDSEVFGPAIAHSLSVYVSAQELPRDIGGFALRERTPERARRIRALIPLLVEELKSFRQLDKMLERHLLSGKTKTRIVGGAMVLIGTAIAPTLLWAGGGMVAAGAMALGQAGDTHKKQIARIKKDLDVLIQDLQ